MDRGPHPVERLTATQRGLFGISSRARRAAQPDGAEQRGEFEHLVVVAPATALGELRKAFGPHLHKRLFSEVVHDYAHQSNDYIYQHIKDSLPL